MNTLRILLVDDHESVRRELRSLLSSHSDWQVCAEAADGLEAVEKARGFRPDVVLMDISMPRMNGLEATRIIRKELPETRIVIISQNDPSVARRQTEGVGAAGFASKMGLAEELPPMLERMFGDTAKVEDTPQAGPAPRASGTPVWLSGGGTLGQLIRGYDWSRTPLGPLENWPQSLKTSVNLMVNSRHPMWIGWGRDITFLYNDAYIDVLSLAKHPAALGMPAAKVWAEIWDICGPLANKVFQEGEASFVDDVRLFMNRGTFLEETYYSFSYSPIRDESGKVTGLFCPSTEVTPKVINARRLRTLAELSANALTQRTINSACSTVAATLAKNPDDIPFAALYVIDSERKEARLAESYGFPGDKDDLLPRAVDLSGRNRSGTPWPIAEVAISQQGQIAPLRGLVGLPHGLADQDISESMVLPVTSRGETHPLGVLIAGVNPTRRLDAEYRTFYELVAGQTATAIQNSRAIEDERKRIEALAEVDRAKTAFFSNVSHEFRTPLTLMLGPVEELLARSHTDLSPSAKNQLELVNRNGSRLLRLVNTLLDFSRIEAGRMQATYQPTDLSAFTKELAGVFRSATDKAGLELELDCPPLAEPVYVDRNLWEKIVLNLMSNAFKFTFDGKISVQLKPAGQDVELRVADTGVGIPAAELPRLFDRFHRVENSRSRTHEGSGIGLALVQELARQHGGTVRVESTLGRGSMFTVSIPMGTAHLAPERIEKERSASSTSPGANPFVEEALRWLPDNAQEELGDPISEDEFVAEPTAPRGEESAGRRPFIVLADDNADMRQYLVRLLSERYEVQAVPDGQAALEAIRARAPDLVLTDVMMPRLDGFALLGELRADPATRTIPIIVLSARAGEESRVEGLQHGADDYLVKPFSARELLARVQTHLELARIRRESAEAVTLRTAQFETLFNEAPLGVYLVGSDFRIREINPQARTTFGDIPDLIGRDFGEVIHILWPPPYADEIVRQFRHTLESGEPYFVGEHTERRLDRGVPEIYEWQINRMSLPEGNFGVVCYFREISSQVRAREGLKENENRLRKLSETLDAEVRERTKELEERNADVVRQSQQVRTLSRRLLLAQDEERRHVARELHDSAGQTMSVLAMNLSQLVAHTANAAPHLSKQASATQELVRQLNQEIRTASYLLHPPLLDETGLTAAVSWYIDGLRERSGLDIQFNIPDSFPRLPQELELVIFRVLQECLTNIHRHSGSKTAAIRIVRDSDHVKIEVQDHGRGMSPERLAQIQLQGSGVGIRGMRERVRQFEGNVHIESGSSGTRITVTIPVPPPVQLNATTREEPRAAI